MYKKLRPYLIPMIGALLGILAIGSLSIPPTHPQGGQQATPYTISYFDALAQAANVPSTLVYPVAQRGMYRANCYVEVTQAATTSSTMPQCAVSWTTQDSAAAVTANLTATSTANTVGTNSAQQTLAGVAPIKIAASTNLNISTTGYASVGATPMQYAVHFKVEYLGP